MNRKNKRMLQNRYYKNTHLYISIAERYLNVVNGKDLEHLKSFIEELKGFSKVIKQLHHDEFIRVYNSYLLPSKFDMNVEVGYYMKPEHILERFRNKIHIFYENEKAIARDALIDTLIDDK